MNNNEELSKQLLLLAIQATIAEKNNLATFLLNCSEALDNADATIAKLRTGLS